MTHLEMINNILKRLRERQVSSVNETAYSAQISMLINDAKDEVENAWDWTALRTTLTATTSADVFSYTLTGTDSTIEIIDVLNDTSNIVMCSKTEQEMNEAFLLGGSVAEGPPTHYSFNGVSISGEAVVDIYPVPDTAYTLRFNIVHRQADLEADTDATLLPSRPILLLAYAKAVEERGEDAGASASSAYVTALSSLSDYIAIDAAKKPEELIWRVL